MNNWGNGIGLLGVSGKYGEISKNDQEIALEYILKNFDFIDTASVYGEEWPVNNVLAKIVSNSNIKLPRLINKIGANLAQDTDVTRLVEEFEVQNDVLKDYPVDLLMLHRPAVSLIERDIQFYNYFKEKLDKTLFGISTNSLDVVKNYRKFMKLDVIQIAVNLLDYKNNEPLLQYCTSNKIVVHARSVLSSGLLSGKYQLNKEVNFTDPMRTRFTDTQKSSQIMNERLSKVPSIQAYYERYKKNHEDLSQAQFLYALTNASPHIESVIKGGSNLEQIRENSFQYKVSDNELITKSFNEGCEQWSSRYL